MIKGPSRLANHSLWSAEYQDVAVRFIGRGPLQSRTELLHQTGEGGLALVTVEQRHTALCRTANAGAAPSVGDALWSDRSGLALSVVTADCVPLLLAGEGEIAAVHAGWRGIAAGVVRSALRRFTTSPSQLRAWIGPSIGRCCYEVGEKVATEVAAASTSSAVSWPRGPGRRPHLDLALAVVSQLRAAGVTAIESIELCTRCRKDLLWSYRREGPGRGRNVALIWRS